MHRRLFLLALTFATLAAVAASLLVASASAAAHRWTVCAGGCAFTTIPPALAAASDGDVIAIGPGSYGGGFTIAKNVTLRGAGAGQTTISGRDASIVGPVSNTVAVASGWVVTITGFTIGTPPDNPGNGVVNYGALTLKESTVRDAGAVFGGGIVNFGTMTLKTSTVTNNFADVGGGIDNLGTMTLKDSTVTGNNAGLVGGGIQNGEGVYNGTLTLDDSTVTSNTAGFVGGGINNSAGSTVRLNDSTVTGNTPSNCVGC